MERKTGCFSETGCRIVNIPHSVQMLRSDRFIIRLQKKSDPVLSVSDQHPDESSEKLLKGVK